MDPKKGKDKNKRLSKEDELLLVEVTLDELELLNRHRAVYGEIVKGKTYSEQPAYLETTVETPDKLITLKYNPLTTKFRDMAKKRNPDKISFMHFTDGRNRLEFCAYSNSDRDLWFGFLNGESIHLHTDDWKRMFRGLNRIRAYLGVDKRRKHRKRRKTP